MNRREYSSGSLQGNQFDRQMRGQQVYHPMPQQPQRNQLQPPQIQQIPQQIPIQQEESQIKYFDTSKPYPIESVFLQTQNPESDKEFDIANLGIDLLSTNSLLPSVYYVGSDAPMITQGQYPASIHYPQQLTGPPISTKIRQVNDFVLFFLFYLHPRDKLQSEAASELLSRKYKFDREKKVWVNQSEKYFDPHTWSFVELSKWGTVPHYV